ncbi:MAG: metal-dependent hydrolase [Anaerolineaceae bacterium]|nr:metal-dependent hydrolase [Anaerolineaceae bacterium]
MSFLLTWYGHSAFLLNVDQHRILIDPYLSGNPMSPVKPDTIDADFILVSHGHGDHLGDSVAIAKRTGATVISNAEICDWLREKGVKTHAQHIGGGFSHPFGYLKLTTATHGSKLPDGTYGGNPAGFLLTTPYSDRLYFAGDTGLFGDMKLIGEEGLDVAILPIGDNYTMGPGDALRAVKLLQPQMVIPIHYNTTKLIQQDVAAWAERVEMETSAKVKVMKPGEEIAIQ